MHEARARLVRTLFTSDKETRRIFGGPLFTSDIRAELEQHEHFVRHAQKYQERPRLRLGKVALDKYGRPLAYIGLSVVRSAQPTKYEHAHVYAGNYPVEMDGTFVPINGVFVRRLIVRTDARRHGYGKMLFVYAKKLSELFRVPLYCDTQAGNATMRRFVRAIGGQESSFWFTPKKTLMVRYLFR